MKNLGRKESMQHGITYEGRQVETHVEIRASWEKEGKWHRLNKKTPDEASANRVFEDWLNGSDDTLCIVT